MGDKSEGDTRQAPNGNLVLVVEDEFLIAMELEAVLTSAGFVVLGPATSVATALRLLEHHAPSAAVLDVNLGGERVTPVAQALNGRGIPYVLASAYIDADVANEPLLASTVNIGKPTSPSRLRSEVGRMLAGSGAA